MLSNERLQHLLALAQQAVDEAAVVFRSKVGAAPALMKDKGDFATEADLEIEALLRSRLTRETGLPVFGEEAGGDLNAEVCWVLDPIDGTSNYSCGNPQCAILVSLLVEGQPVVAITDMPLLGKRLTALDSQPVMLNGQPLPPVAHDGDRFSSAAQVGVASIGSDDRDRFPAQQRLAFVGALVDTALRPRMTGSVGIDLAYVSLGIFQAAVSFSPHVWDNAAGVLLARCAGAVVTDVDGNPWKLGAVGAIAGTRAAHALALQAVQENFNC